VTRAAVFGAGSWGTAFGAVLADAGTDTTVWARRPELAEAIRERHENPDYLAGVRLPDGVGATTDPGAALDGADFVVLAIPAQTLRENLSRWVPLVPAHAVLVSLMKGVELGTTKRMSEVIREVADVPADRVAVVSGPNLAGEIARRQPAATVVACEHGPAAERLQDACLTGYFRPYTNPDVTGTELGGAVKNVITIAVGMADGMGLGDNAKASLITRGLAEIARLGGALGADPMTFAGLAGLGDLVCSCMSPLSRNRTVGERLGRGHSVAEVTSQLRTVAEGVTSSQSILDLARKHHVYMPITEHVVAVLNGDMTPAEMLRSMMTRGAKPERHDAERRQRGG
jgi:glycerol-3-phosphate dehydrogenase (NAD(P)+)